MEDSKIEERKNFMKRMKTIPALILNIAAYQDPLKKREEFAVSLRKKKTSEIINAKRRRLIGTNGTIGDETQGGGLDSKQHGSHSQHYKGLDRYEKNLDEYNQLLGNLCPQVIQDRTLSIVSAHYKLTRVE